MKLLIRDFFLCAGIVALGFFGWKALDFLLYLVR
jgi:hypothetical protein